MRKVIGLRNLFGININFFQSFTLGISIFLKYKKYNSKVHNKYQNKECYYCKRPYIKDIPKLFILTIQYFLVLFFIGNYNIFEV